jgi:N-acetyl-gamma-glutamyl-phosphate reductase
VLTCFSLTGYSGGGKKLIAAYGQSPLPTPLQSPRPYALGLRHKHLPEMVAHTGLTSAPVFVPVVANFYRGLLLTIPLALRQFSARPSPAEVHRILAETYAGEKFVRVLPFADDSILDGDAFDVQACNGTNRCDLALFADEGRAALMARLDNLGKGASGAAIQCMNLHLGLDEATGLELASEV